MVYIWSTKINPQNYLETHVANPIAPVLNIARSFNVILLTHMFVLWLAWLERLILIISFVYFLRYSCIFMQCSHHAQSYTRNASSSVEVVQGEVSYNQETWTHEFTRCGIKPRKFYPQNLIHLQICLFVKPWKFYPRNLIRVRYVSHYVA